MGASCRMRISASQERRQSPEEAARAEALAEKRLTAAAESCLASQSALRHPEIPQAARGLEGMRTAHEILASRASIGILIGGLARALCSPGAGMEDLARHKDVDVFVLKTPGGRDFTLSKPFEGGIDWWMPEGDGWQNANGVKLAFKLLQPGWAPIQRGLSISLPGLLGAITCVEALSFAKTANDELRWKIGDIYRASAQSCLPPENLRDEFGVVGVTREYRAGFKEFAGGAIEICDGFRSTKDESDWRY